MVELTIYTLASANGVEVTESIILPDIRICALAKPERKAKNRIKAIGLNLLFLVIRFRGSFMIRYRLKGFDLIYFFARV
jgi:hypothetical protein